MSVREAYATLERELFAAESDEERDRITELLKLTRAQFADDSASNDRQRFGGQRTLSLDRFAEEGYEPSNPEETSRLVLEEQEALEEGFRPFLSELTMEQADATRAIFRYGFSYRDGARRLNITTPALQRRIRRSLDALRKSLLRAAGFIEEGEEA